MPSTLDSLRERRQEIIDIAAKHGVYNIRVFGSVVRNEDHPDSDIDLLVSRGEKVSRWFPARYCQACNNSIFNVCYPAKAHLLLIIMFGTFVLV